MGNKKKSSLYLLLLIPAVIVAGLYVFYRIKKQHFLESGLQHVVEKKTDSLYKISYDSIWVNEVEGDLYIKNLHIKGDTARQMQMIKHGDTNAAKVVLEIYIPTLEVVGFKTANALLAKQLRCRKIIISDPKIALYLYPGQAQHKDEMEQRLELYKQILGNFKLIQADEVSVINSEAIAKDYFTREVKFRTLCTSIDLHNVLIDSTYKEDTTRTLFCKEIKISSNKVILGEKNNTAQISNLVFNTTSKVILISRLDYDAFKNNGFFKTSLQDISVEGIEWKGPAERSDLRIGSVVLKKGEIETLTGDANKKGNTSKFNNKILTGWIKNFFLGELQVKSFMLTTRSQDKTKKPIIVKNNALMIKGVKLDTVSRLNENLVNNVGEADFYNDNLTIISEDKFYEYKILGFRLNTKLKKVWIKQVAIVPQFAEEEFARRSKVQRDRFDVSLNKIECNDVDISRLVRGELYASTLTTRNSSVKVYRDISYPPTGKNNLGMYPQQLLFKLEIPVRIKRFMGYDNYVAYKERNPLSDSSGTVTFNHSNVAITNVSNLPPKAGDRCIAEFNSKFLDALPLKGSFTFYMDEWQKGTFKVEASVSESFDAKILNQLTRPMSLTNITRGTFDYISCSLMANNSIAKGKFIMTYHDFEIALLKKKGEEIHKKNLSSIVANAFIKDKNTAGGHMREATILKQRNVKRSFFNFVWVSIFSGGQKILGVPIKK